MQYGDPPERNSKAEAKTEFVLVNDEGKETKLRLDEDKAKAAGGPRAFDSKRVKVKGNRVSNGEDRLEVQEIDFEQPRDAAEAKARRDSGQPAAQALASEGPTSKPWVTIGCSFSDSPTPDSSKRGYFEDLMGVFTSTEEKPGLDHYWKEVSFDNMNVDGSQVGDGVKAATF